MKIEVIVMVIISMKIEVIVIVMVLMVIISMKIEVIVIVIIMVIISTIFHYSLASAATTNDIQHDRQKAETCVLNNTVEVHV